jgi:hypothetical protein
MNQSWKDTAKDLFINGKSEEGIACWVVQRYPEVGLLEVLKYVADLHTENDHGTH